MDTDIESGVCMYVVHAYVAFVCPQNSLMSKLGPFYLGKKNIKELMVDSFFCECVNFEDDNHIARSTYSSFVVSVR